MYILIIVKYYNNYKASKYTVSTNPNLLHALPQLKSMQRRCSSFILNYMLLYYIVLIWVLTTYISANMTTHAFTALNFLRTGTIVWQRHMYRFPLLMFITTLHIFRFVTIFSLSSCVADFITFPSRPTFLQCEE